MKKIFIVLILILIILSPDFIFAQTSSSQRVAIRTQDVDALARDYIKDKKEREQVERPQGLKILGEADPAWNFIREKKIETAHPAALADLIDIAMRNNFKTRQAWYNIEVAQAQKRQAESALYPQLNAEFDAYIEAKSGKLKLAGSNDIKFDPSLSLTYLLLDFGGRSASIRQAAHMLSSSSALHNKAIQDLFLSVQQSYYKLYSAQANEEASRLNLETSKVDLDAAKARFNAGLAAKLDVLQAQSDHDNAAYLLVIAKNDVKIAKASLAQTLGFSADTDIVIMPPSKELPIGPADADATLLIDKAMQERPDIASAREVLRSKQEAVNAANSKLFPTLSAGGDLSYGDTATGERQYNYSIFLSAVWDIFDGFYNLNVKKEAQAAAKAEYESLLQAELEASKDVWVSYHNFSASINKFQCSKSLLISTSASYDLALQSYKAGLKSMLDLIQAKNDLADARSKVIQSRQDVFVAFAELAHATGSFDILSQGRNFTPLMTQK